MIVGFLRFLRTFPLKQSLESIFSDGIYMADFGRPHLRVTAQLMQRLLQDILDTQTIYSLIAETSDFGYFEEVTLIPRNHNRMRKLAELEALTTYYNKFFAQCSRAFIKLEVNCSVVFILAPSLLATHV